MMPPGQTKFNFEFEEKIDVGLIGCGGQAYRNILPSFQYAPINLVATSDIFESRSKAFCKLFGGERYYTDYRHMLEKEDLDAVFIVVNPDQQGRPQYPKIAIDAMRAGCHVWQEKPPAASLAEVREMIGVSRETGKFVAIGFKTCFIPAYEKVREIVQRQDFKASSIYVRFPLVLPAKNEKDLGQKPLQMFLDGLPHPGSLMKYLMGKVKHIFYERNPAGGGVVLMKFLNGADGILHCTRGQSANSFSMRVEVVGESSNVVVDNGIKLTYYPPTADSYLYTGYGRTVNYIHNDSVAPIYWEPIFFPGDLYNKGLFLLGYWGEVNYFADCVLKHRPPEKCGLEDALEFMKLYEAFLRPEGQIITVN